MSVLEVNTHTHKRTHARMPTSTHARMHTHTHNRFTALWILSGTTHVSRYQKKHSPSHNYRGHQSSFICFIHLIRFVASSLFNLHAWQSFFSQSLSKFSLVYLLAWHPPLHTPYISSPNHCLLFAAHANTIATCFTVVPRLCLSQPLLVLEVNTME